MIFWDKGATYCVFKRLGVGKYIKPVAYTAFVVTEKIKKRLKAKQRQPARKALWLRAYLSFVGSFF